jgi:protein disulfide-isomerase
MNSGSGTEPEGGNMNKWLVILAAAAISAGAAATEGWETDFEKAKAKAKAEGKHLLIDFSGSDWCSWCVKLDKEVFSKPEFKTYADENLILLLVDWPQRAPNSKEVQAVSKPIMDTFGVKSFPTVIILDPDGKAVAKTGYKDGGPEVYVAHIKKLIADAKEE